MQLGAGRDEIVFADIFLARGSDQGLLEEQSARVQGEKVLGDGQAFGFPGQYKNRIRRPVDQGFK